MTLELYGDFKSQEHLKFLASEDRMRFRLFRSNAQLVAQANEEGGSAIFGLNFFSALTEDEKQQYLGLNVTGHDENPMHVASSSFSAPEKKLWTTEGLVTAVKNQGSCGSCWTFGAVGGLETRYHGVSGKLRSFAEQEYLDCVYEGQRNGCNGGWPASVLKDTATSSAAIMPTEDYEYKATKGSCQVNSKSPSMKI